MTEKKKSYMAFRTISEASEILEVPAHVLRFWEKKFESIAPLKRGGGRRYYRPNDISLLYGIKYLLYSKGYSIKKTQTLLRKKDKREILRIGKEKYLHQSTVSADSVRKAFENTRKEYFSNRDELIERIGKRFDFFKDHEKGELIKLLKKFKSISAKISQRIH